MDHPIKTPETHPDHPVVGHDFSGTNWTDKKTSDNYYCDSYDPRIGYWMTGIEIPEDRRNVSERAINRTFHHQRKCRKCSVDA